MIFFTTKLKNKLIFTLLILLTFSANLSAQTNSKTVKIGYFENEVFQEGAENNKFKKGYAYEYYRKLSEYTGWNYEYIYGNFIDLYNMLEEGKIDLLAGLAYTEERSKSILYENKPMGSTRYYFLKQSERFDITSEPETLNNKKIGVLNSLMTSILNNWLKENKITANVVVYDDIQTLQNAFYKKDLDIVMVEGLGSYGRENCEAFIYVGSTDYYLCVNKNRPDLLAELNKAHNQMDTDNPNFISSIYSKYYSKTVSSKALSQEEINYLNNHSNITIGYLTDYLPYCDIDSNGELTGFLKDIIPEQINQLGLNNKVQVNYKPFESFSELITALKTDIVDIAFPVGGGLYFSEQGGFYQSQPVINSSVAIVYYEDFKKDHAPIFAVNRNNDMQGYYVKSNFPEGFINYYNSINACLDSVLKGESDYVTVNGLRVIDLLKNTKYKNLKYRLLAQADERCFGVKIGNESLLRIVNRGINAVGEQYILNQAYPYTEELHKYSFGDYFRSIVYILIPLFLITGLVIIIHIIGTREKLRVLNMRLEEALASRDRYITDMIRYASSEADADKIIRQMVEYIGKNTNCDRVYIFEENKTKGFDNTYEWCNEGITKEIDNLQNVPYEVLEPWVVEFDKRGNVIIKDLEEYKHVSKPIYDVLKPQNIKTLAAVPLIVRGKIIGFLGVDNPPVVGIDDISEFLKLVEFFFSLMIRLRNGVISISEMALHDQLSGFLNRRAYKEEIGKYKTKAWEKDFVYVSIDINGLKVANDTIGHEAGDELITGACKCMEKCLGPYGNLYRTGGDEFIALLHVNEEQLSQIKENLQKECDNWRGKLVDSLSLSCGYVSVKEHPRLNVHEIEVLADKFMYQEKSNYYRNKGIDRRGQRDAHTALCALYTKILKINLNEDSYQIINMDEKEQTEEQGFAEKLSDWLENFGKSGQVHPDDLQEYEAKTNLDYITEYFAKGNKAFRIIYRRRYSTGYQKVLMEIIPANDYRNDNKNMFLYVKVID